MPTFDVEGRSAEDVYNDSGSNDIKTIFRNFQELKAKATWQMTAIQFELSDDVWKKWDRNNV